MYTIYYYIYIFMLYLSIWCNIYILYIYIYIYIYIKNKDCNDRLKSQSENITVRYCAYCTKRSFQWLWDFKKKQTNKQTIKNTHYHYLLCLLSLQRNPPLSSLTECPLSALFSTTNLHTIRKPLPLIYSSRHKSKFATYLTYIVIIRRT